LVRNYFRIVVLKFVSAPGGGGGDAKRGQKGHLKL